MRLAGHRTWNMLGTCVGLQLNDAAAQQSDFVMYLNFLLCSLGTSYPTFLSGQSEA